MKYSMPILALLALAGVMQMPQPAHAQKDKAIVDLQRYVFDLERTLKAAQAEQNERLAAIEASQQKQLQAIDALSAQLKSLQQETQRALTEQQKRVAEPVEVLRSAFDGMSSNMSGLQAAQGDIARRTSAIEQKIEEMMTFLKTMSIAAQPDAPPPPENPESPLLIQQNLFTSGVRDFSGGRDELAMEQFMELVNKYPTSPDAPQAYIYIGLLYDRAKQYNEAVTAYERVITLYPDSSQVSEAMYSKGESLRLANKKQDSITAFRAFLAKFPNDPKAETAKAKIREQGGRP